MEPFELLGYVVRVLEQLAVPYLVTGSTATIAYGEPRFTNDIDILVDLRLNQVADFCDAFPAPEFYVSRPAAEAAVRRHHQFNIIHPSSGLKIVVIVASDSPFDRSRLRRGRRLSAGANLQVCFGSPEDVILKKLEYFREGGSEKHLRDIAGVLKVQGQRVDRQYIVEWAGRLGVLDIWQAVAKRTDQTP
jgi:hypothetical protein